MTQPIYTVKQAAKELCISQSSVAKLVKSGQIPHFKVGQKGVRITRKALALYVKASGGLDLYEDITIEGPALVEHTKVVAQARARLEAEAAEAKAKAAAAEAAAAASGKATTKGKKK